MLCPSKVVTRSFYEFMDVTRNEPKIMYAYHYQDVDHNLIFRYDNAAHKPVLPQPEHKHTSLSVEVSPAPKGIDGEKVKDFWFLIKEREKIHFFLFYLEVKKSYVQLN